MKRFFSVAGQVLTILLLLVSVGVLLFTVVSVRTVGQQGSVFGYRAYTVLSDSMSDTFEAGDVVISKSVDPATLEVGDIITFSSIDPETFGQVFTHKIREVTTYEGEPAFVTYGTTTGSDDSYPVPFANVMGVYVSSVPNLGEFFQFFKTPKGYVFVVLIPFLLLILVQLIHFFKLLKEYREEKNEAMSRHTQDMEQKLQEAERMRAELEELRAQLGQQKEEGQEVPQDTNQETLVK